MKLGLYTFAALTLMALVGAFVYTLELGSYRLDMLNISLPITVWIILPALIAGIIVGEVLAIIYI